MVCSATEVAAMPPRLSEATLKTALLVALHRFHRCGFQIVKETSAQHLSTPCHCKLLPTIAQVVRDAWPISSAYTFPMSLFVQNLVPPARDRQGTYERGALQSHSDFCQ
jgi:hypothetical protein